MAAKLDTYISDSKAGLPNKDDVNFVEDLLKKFMNKHTALFQRWIDVQFVNKKEKKQRLVVLTPLRLILIKKKAFGNKAVHKKIKIIDFTSITFDDAPGDHTKCIMESMDFSPNLSIAAARDPEVSQLTKERIELMLPKDVDREFGDVLQWCLFILTRGLPDQYKPKVTIPPSFVKEINDPVGPGQFVIDRYVASCDAQNQNRGAGIPALENVIDYVFNRLQVFDVFEAFKGDKKIDYLQFVALSHGLAFTEVYDRLVINGLQTTDDNLSVLMTALETNPFITALEFRRTEAKKKTMMALASALANGSALTNGLHSLQELDIIDITLDKTTLMCLAPGFKHIQLHTLRVTNCHLNSKATSMLFKALEDSKQYKTLTHINLSQNECGKGGSKHIASFLKKTQNLRSLVVCDANIIGDEFFKGLKFEENKDDDEAKDEKESQKKKRKSTHLDTLTLLDFSGNVVGDKGAMNLSQFVSRARALNFLKLSRCNLTVPQLQKIFQGAVFNMSGFELGQYDPVIRSLDARRASNAQLNMAISKDMESQSVDIASTQLKHAPSERQFREVPKRPTQTDIMLCSHLLCLSLDLSDNNIGNKGAMTMVELLNERENYTIVSLNLANNNIDVRELCLLVRSLTSLACLERLCLSENVNKGMFTKNNDKNGELGKAMCYLFEQTTTLGELAITGNESTNSYVDYGLIPLLEKLPLLSNLEFIDISGNKLGDPGMSVLTNSLEMNRTIRLIKCSDNKCSGETLIKYLEVLSEHTSLIDRIPFNDIDRYSKNKKYAIQLKELKNKARGNLGDNRMQYDMNREMLSQLSPELRMEKELRRQCGYQFGIPIERIRGTIKFPDYESRIPQILVRLKDYLKTKGGFRTQGIFRLQPNGEEFKQIRRRLNQNDDDYRVDDINCIANAIKVWYRDLPIKVLNPVPVDMVSKCSSPEEATKIITHIPEPYRSLFEWLLDLAVDVSADVRINKMDAKNMAVVLCPNLYESSDQSPAALTFSASLLKFTEFAIKARIEFRRTHPYRPADDMPYIKMGVTLATELPAELQAKFQRRRSLEDRDDSKGMSDEMVAPASDDSYLVGAEGELKRPKTTDVEGMEQGGGFYVSSMYGGGRTRGASILQGAVVVKPRPKPGDALESEPESQANIPPPAAYEPEPEKKPPPPTIEEVPTHIRRGTGVLAGIKPMNYRDQKMMSDLNGGRNSKKGDIDYIGHPEAESALSDDEDESSDEEEVGQQKKKKKQMMVMEVGGGGAMMARRPQPPPKMRGSVSGRKGQPPPPARVSGKLAQRFSAIAAQIDPAKLKPGAAPPAKKVPAHFAAIGIDPTNAAAESKVDNNEINGSDVRRPSAVSGRKRKSRKVKAELLVDEDDPNAGAAVLQQSATEEVASQSAPPEDANDPFADAPPAAFAPDAFAMPGGEAEQKQAGGKKRKSGKVKGSNMQLLDSDEDSDDTNKVLSPSQNRLGAGMFSGASAPSAPGAGADAAGAGVEEKRFTFDTKPMGFQIEAEDQVISVRNVRPYTKAEQFGIKKKWQIVEVNGYRDWLSMLNILEQSMGPFDIVFAAESDAPLEPEQIVNKDRASSVIAADALNAMPQPQFTPIDESVINKIGNNAAKQEVLRLQQEASALAQTNAQLLETLEIIKAKGDAEHHQNEKLKVYENANQQLRKEVESLRPLQFEMRKLQNEAAQQRQEIYNYKMLLDRLQQEDEDDDDDSEDDSDDSDDDDEDSSDSEDESDESSSDESSSEDRKSKKKRKKKKSKKKSKKKKR